MLLVLLWEFQAWTAAACRRLDAQLLLLCEPPDDDMAEARDVWEYDKCIFHYLILCEQVLYYLLLRAHTWQKPAAIFSTKCRCASLFPQPLVFTRRDPLGGFPQSVASQQMHRAGVVFTRCSCFARSRSERLITPGGARTGTRRALILCITYLCVYHV